MGSKAIQGVGSNFSFAQAADLASDLHSSLLEVGVENVCVAGSLRRQLPTINDLDLVVLATQPEQVMSLGAWMQRHGVQNWDNARSTGAFAAPVYGEAAPMQVDIYLVRSHWQWGTQIMTWTGPKAHNIAMRTWAKAHGWKLSQNGLEKNGECYMTFTEEEVFSTLGLPFIPPTVRDLYTTASSIFKLSHSTEQVA